MAATVHAAISPAQQELFGKNNISFFGFVKIPGFKSFWHGLKIKRFLVTFDAMRIETLEDFFGNGNSLDILRLDLPAPLSGGNKSFKLNYNIRAMKEAGLNTLVTFGGAFSNHIAAVANAGKKEKIKTIGIIRGNELNENSNAVLKFASQCGMEMFFVSREKYRERNEPGFIEAIFSNPGQYYILPEGGSNELAVRGCKEILSEATEKYKKIILPVGTGATMAGIIAAAKPHQHIIGIAVLEGRNYLENEVQKLLQNENPSASWEIDHDFTFGGYAKSSAGLEDFIPEMKSKYNLPLDPVYSGKALFAAYKTLKGSTGSPCLFVHTGGYAFYKEGPSDYCRENCIQPV